MNDYEIKNLYDKLEGLRNEVKSNINALNYYEYLKEFNKNDQMYGWIYSNNDILSESLDDLSMYQTAYIKDVLNFYINELSNILLKVNL